MSKTEESLIDNQQQLDFLKSSCFSDPAMYRWGFDQDNVQNSAMNKVRFFASHWSEMEAKNIGLALYGPVGTGKTFAAACIANALIEQCVSVKMLSLSTILNDLHLSSKKTSYLDELMKHRLLILDDFGIERKTEFALEQIFQVIDRREKSDKPLIITTNLSISAMKHTDDLMQKRIYDRVLHMCMPIAFTGENIRERKTEEKMRYAKELFSEVK